MSRAHDRYASPLSKIGGKYQNRTDARPSSQGTIGISYAVLPITLTFHFKFGSREGTRTLTPSLATDFKSVVSAIPPLDQLSKIYSNVLQVWFLVSDFVLGSSGTFCHSLLKYSTIPHQILQVFFCDFL